MAQVAPQSSPSAAPSGVDLIAMASTMFSIFYGVWWGTLLAAVNQKSAELERSTGDSHAYQVWLKDSAYLAAVLVVILSIHALVVAHLKIIPASGTQVWGEIAIVVGLGYVAYRLAEAFLDQTVRDFALDPSYASNGNALLKYWLIATWLLVAISKVYAAVIPRARSTVAVIRSLMAAHQGAKP